MLIKKSLDGVGTERTWDSREGRSYHQSEIVPILLRRVHDLRCLRMQLRLRIASSLLKREEPQIATKKSWDRKRSSRGHVESWYELTQANIVESHGSTWPTKSGRPHKNSTSDESVLVMSPVVRSSREALIFASNSS
jgi:hypothetical protein